MSKREQQSNGKHYPWLFCRETRDVFARFLCFEVGVWLPVGGAPIGKDGKLNEKIIKALMDEPLSYSHIMEEYASIPGVTTAYENLSATKS